MNRTPDDDLSHFARLLGEVNEAEPTRAERIADRVFLVFFAVALVAIAYLMIAGVMIIPELAELVR